MISSQRIDCNCSYLKTCWIWTSYIHYWILSLYHTLWHNNCAVLLIRWIHPFTLEDLVKNCGYLKVKPSSFMITMKWRLRKECRNSILMTVTMHYPFLLKIGQIESKFPLWHNPIRGPVTQIRVVIRYYYDISGLVPQTCCGEIDRVVAYSEMSTRFSDYMYKKNTKSGHWWKNLEPIKMDCSCGFWTC